jgi:hypothetical protein
VEWPAWSSHLNIRNFFLRENFKENVFKRRPHTLPELTERIIEEVKAIPRDMYEGAVLNLRNRLQQCVVANGRHLEDIIFQTE